MLLVGKESGLVIAVFVYAAITSGYANARVINIGGVLGWRAGVAYDKVHAVVGDVLVSSQDLVDHGCDCNGHRLIAE
jgi:hypothetical protein